MADEGRPPVSRGAVAILVALLVLAIGAFAWMARQSAQRAREDPAARSVEVSLDRFERTLANGDRFAAVVVLRLDASRADDRARVVAMRESLRSIVNLEIVYRKPEADLRRGHVETLALEIRDRLNRELQAAGLGGGAIVEARLDPSLPAPGN